MTNQEFIKFMDTRSVESEQLDELVHEAKGAEAVNINNYGSVDQLEYLLGVGYTAQGIWDSLSAGATLQEEFSKWQKPRTDEWYIQQARLDWQKDGEIEIDDNAVVSRGDESGSYVAAWVWVSKGMEDNG